MNHTPKEVINGLANYMDAEVMNKLPSSGKWIMGTVITLASSKAENAIDILSDNPIVQMLDLIDEDGNIDTDSLINAMKTSADKYGNMSVAVPMIGEMTFSSKDIDKLKQYIG